MSVKVSKISEKVATERVVDGIIVKGENNPEYGSIMFEEVAFTNAGGFLNKQKRVAFLRGEVKTLQDYVSSLGLKAGSEITGKIVVVESTEPFFEGQEPKKNPKTDQIITHDGAFVYRNSYLHNGEEVDQLLTSDKVTDVYVNEEHKALEAMGK